MIALAVAWVFRGALAFYFAQDDFRELAVAAGVLPRRASLWRYLSIQTFMDVLYPLFRDQPRPYHVASLILHGANAGLLFALLSRRFSRPAAFAAASFFAVHPALFTALYWVSARPDILATTFALGTVALALTRGPERWLAVPAFAASLLCKESTLLVPAAIALLEAWRSPPARAEGAPASRRPIALLSVLFAMSLGLGLYLVFSWQAGGFGPGTAYAFDFGVSVLRNLLTYVGWTVDLPALTPGLRFVDVQNPALFPLAIGALAFAGLLGLWPAARKRGWWIGVASFLLLLAPVLPLRNHAYHYYLYAPLAAAALCLAALVDTLLSLLPQPGPEASGLDPAARRDARAREDVAWMAAGTCWLLLTLNGARVVGQMERRPSPVYPAMRADSTVDRALIAERVIQGLRRARIPNGTYLVFILRERIARNARIAKGSGEAPPSREEVYPETNVKVALLGGLGVRALVSAVDSVRFATTLGTPDPRARYVLYAPTGEVEVFDAASLDSLLRSSWVTRW